MFTILHISDLHRSKEEPVDNASLIASLIGDSDRYLGEYPRIPPPKAIIVSGDLIQGVPLNTPGWKKLLDDQYQVAENFLTELCDRFLDGDRSAMAIAPGNHDVCWNTSNIAMNEIVPKNFPRNLQDSLLNPGSNYRWSWEKKNLYQIQNYTKYKERMQSYWDFFERFYDGVKLPIGLNRERGFHFFEVCEKRILIVAFESVYNNDCYSYAGDLAPGVVGKCAIALRDAGRSYDLNVAVWHHGIQGPPLRSDYMNVSHVEEMAGHGFQIGLHGHQHQSYALTQYVHLDQSHAMAIIGAGSLCAGSKELPRGVNRQYNLFVIEDDFMCGRVHVREMGDGGQFSRKRNGQFIDGFIETSWQQAFGITGSDLVPMENNIRSAIEKAECAQYNENPIGVLDHLEHVDHRVHQYARKLLLNALLKLQDWDRMVDLIESPSSTEEHIFLINALIELGELDQAENKLLEETGIDRGTLENLYERIATKKLMKRQ